MTTAPTSPPPDSPAPPPAIPGLLLGLLLAGAVLCAYVPALDGDFVWDDDAFVVDNVHLRSWDGLYRIWFVFGAEPQYYPMVFSTFWVQYQLWGLDTFGYHLVNVLLHAAAALLLWRILRRLGLRAAWLIAAIFALHPVQVESVAWITELKNCLSGFFYMLTAWCLVRFYGFDPEGDGDGVRAGAGRRAGLFYALALVFFILAVLSKTVVTTLPFAFALVLFWKRGGLTRRDAAALGPFFLLAVVLGLLTIWMERELVGAEGEEWDFTLVDRVLIAGRALWFYAGKIVWPVGLSFNYPRWEIDRAAAWQYVFPAAALGALAALWLMRRRLGRGPFVAVSFFAGTLFPALGFFDLYPMRYSFVADHFQYLAAIGVMALLAEAAARHLPAALTSGHAARGMALILPAILGILTWHQAHIYKGLEPLYTDTIRKNPDSFLAHHNLAIYYHGQNRFEAAADHYRETLRLRPRHVRAHVNLAGVLINLGELIEAGDLCRRAIALDPGEPMAWFNLALVHEKRREWAPAAENYRLALERNPDDAAAHYRLHVVLRRLGDERPALEHLRRACALNPQWGHALNELARLLAAHPDPALRQPAEALGIAENINELTAGGIPAYGDTLAMAMAAMGQFDQAAARAEAAAALAEREGDEALAREIRERREMYEQRKAYVLPGIAAQERQ